MNEHWSDYFGNDVTALDVIQSAKTEGMELAAWLRARYTEMVSENGWRDVDPDAVDYDALAEQVIEQAENEAAGRD